MPHYPSFLLGRRDAIERFARDPRTVWLGALFVLVAGLGREYHRSDLTAEPWHLAVPFVASVPMAFFLCLAMGGAEQQPFLRQFRAVLGCFWMTAPLAWIYAVPFEQFLDADNTVRARLASLGLVAVARGVLITRVMSVLNGRPWWANFFVAALFADIAVFVSMVYVPWPVLQVMMAIRLTAGELLLMNTRVWVIFWGVVTAPVWLIGAIAVVWKRNAKWIDLAPQRSAVTPALWATAAVALLAGLAALPFTQPAQRLRTRVETALTTGRLEEGLALMDAHTSDDFPRQWDPPPHLGHAEERPALYDIADALMDRSTSPWVRAIYVDKFECRKLIELRYGNHSPEEFARLERAARGLGLYEANREEIEQLRRDVYERESATRPATAPSTQR